MPRSSAFDMTDEMIACPECQGTGQVSDPRYPERLMPCPLCNGAGRVNRNTANTKALSAYRKLQMRVRKSEVMAEKREREKEEDGTKKKARVVSPRLKKAAKNTRESRDS